jgi:hypothetical protein
MNRRFHSDFVVRSIGTHAEKGTHEPLDVVCSTRALAEETYTRFTSLYVNLEEGYSTAGQFKAETVLLVVRGVIAKRSGPKVAAKIAA